MNFTPILCNNSCPEKTLLIPFVINSDFIIEFLVPKTDMNIFCHSFHNYAIIHVAPVTNSNAVVCSNSNKQLTNEMHPFCNSNFRTNYR